MDRERLKELLGAVLDGRISKLSLDELIRALGEVESIAFSPTRDEVKAIWELRTRLVLEFAARGFSVRILNRRLRATYALATGEHVSPVEEPLRRKRRRL